MAFKPITVPPLVPGTLEQGLFANKGSGTNGAKLTANRDAAPSGQRHVLPITQGGADACPGLRDESPSGLHLVPFAREKGVGYTLLTLKES